jgi:hypothetical protein
MTWLADEDEPEPGSPMSWFNADGRPKTFEEYWAGRNPSFANLGKDATD